MDKFYCLVYSGKMCFIKSLLCRKCQRQQPADSEMCEQKQKDIKKVFGNEYIVSLEVNTVFMQFINLHVGYSLLEVARFEAASFASDFWLNRPSAFKFSILLSLAWFLCSSFDTLG